jgi:ATP/maltotriose-dependent transcriptional regulator MalT
LLAAAPDPTPARATALWVAGWVALLAGDHEQAGELLAEAQQLGEKHGDPLVCAHVEGLRGSLAMFQGRLPESAARFQAAVASFDSLGESPGTLFWLFQLAIVKALLQEADAGQIGRHGVAVAEKHGERLCRSYLLLALGFDAWTRGDTTAGSEFAQAALEIQRSYNDPIGTAMLLDVLTWLTVSRGEYERAARLLGAVDALWRRSTTTDTAFGPHMSGIHTRCTEDVLRILGQAAYDQAFAEGGRHDTPSRAIAFALAKDVGPEQSEAGPDRPLTRRELEIAALVAKGMSNRQIASALRRSPRTVDRHVENILAKLAFASRAQIAAWWTAHHGLAEVPPSFGRF